MTATLVITFIATDRPGIVERISETVSNNGGNWLESRMAHLASKFAGVATVSVSDAQAAAMTSALRALADDDLHLMIEAAAQTAGGDPGPLLRLDLVGADHPGILRDITHCLAERGVSVEEMETSIEAAPHGGGLLFRASAQVRLPAGLDGDDLAAALEDLASALMVDIELGV